MRVPIPTLFCTIVKHRSMVNVCSHYTVVVVVVVVVIVIVVVVVIVIIVVVSRVYQTVCGVEYNRAVVATATVTSTLIFSLSLLQTPLHYE